MRRSLRKLQVELCHLQDWVKPRVCGHHCLRRARRRRQGRHHQGDHRAGQPARLSRGRAAGAVGPPEDADVHPALHRAFPRGRRDRDLRPQLVQPRRRRARHGISSTRGNTSGSSSCARRSRSYIVDGGIKLIKIWLEVGKDEQERRFAARDRRSAAAMEAQPDGPRSPTRAGTSIRRRATGC